MTFIKNLITNNSGLSMKNFILFIGGINTTIVINAFIVLLYLDFYNKDLTLSIDLYAYSSLIIAFEVLLVLLFYYKIRSEKNELRDEIKI